MEEEGKEIVFLDEILLKIFSYMSANQLGKIAVVCKQWYRVSKAPELWKRHVLQKWPSQRFLYENINIRNLEWCKVFQELHQKSWFSPDDMKYFICCKTVSDEPASEGIRQTMFERMAYVSQKWLQVHPYEHDDSNYKNFDKNAELYFDTTLLKWLFLDRRRGYIGDLFPSKKLRMLKRNKKTRHVRPYQVIPSCLVLYRWLCLFGSYATAEDGLTFYRIWRFKLRHLETGMIFEIYDWKAAMNTTFSNGMPGNVKFREDALELLQILSHPHFIMHPLGLQPLLLKSSQYLACASAGGITKPKISAERRMRRKRRFQMQSPAFKDSKMPDGEKSKLRSDVSDNDEESAIKERRGVRRKLSPKPIHPHPISTPTSPRVGSSSSLFSFDRKGYSRESSCSSILSDTEDSERSERESDMESECELPEHGYVVDCEYFIITTHSLDIEEQHSLQASVSDGWMVTHKARPCNIKLSFNAIEGYWYFPTDDDTDASLAGAARMLGNLQRASPIIAPCHGRSGSDLSLPGLSMPELPFHGRSSSDVSLPVEPKTVMRDKHDANKRLKTSLTSLPMSPEARMAHSDDLLSPMLSPRLVPSSATGSQYSISSIGTNASSKFEVGGTNDDFEPLESIPSSLALYRLICLFDLNCSMYRSMDDTSVWSVKLLHKKTGGIVQFSDYNGWFQVHASIEHTPPQSQDNSGGESADEEATSTTASSYGNRDPTLDTSDFKAALLQIMDLLMDDKFSHPYGTVAGSVA